MATMLRHCQYSCFLLSLEFVPGVVCPLVPQRVPVPVLALVVGEVVDGVGVLAVCVVASEEVKLF